MHLEGMLSLMRQSTPYQGLLETLRADQAGSAPSQRILRAARPFVVAALAQDLNRPTLVVTALVERAYNVSEQLKNPYRLYRRRLRLHPTRPGKARRRIACTWKECYP